MVKQKQKKILAISHYYMTDNRGGGEIMLHELLKQLVVDGYKVDAIAPCNDGPVVIVDGVTVYRGEKYRDKDFSKYDGIVMQFAEADAAVLKAKKLKIPIIYIVHNSADPTVFFLKKYNPELTVFNTKWIKDFHKHDGNSMIVHPPVYREAHITTPGDKITLINLMAAKGSNMFYNMAFRLSRFQFLGVEGGYAKEKQQYIKRPNIEFIKNTDNMKEDVWSKTKVLLMPSAYESYGMAAIEALASGIPVVASSTPGLIESLGYAGLFPRTSNIGEWRALISKLMLDPEFYQKQSELCIKRSLEIDPKIELKEFSKKVKEII